MKLRRTLALVMALCMCLSLGAFASGTPDTSLGGQATSAPPDNSTKAVDLLGEQAVMYYEYASDGYTLAYTPAFKDEFTRQAELKVPEIGTPFEDGGVSILDNSIYWNEDSEVGTSGVVINCLTDTETPFTFGGDEDYYEAPDGNEYNSVIIMNKSEDDVVPDDATETAAGVGLAFNGSSLELKNIYISSAGSGRPCVLIPSPTRDSDNVSQLGNLICVDSRFCEDSNRALLLMGGDVWFLNSDVTTNYWGGLSYDNTSTTMYVVNSGVYNTGSFGYGIYDAAGCTAYLYGIKDVAGDNPVTVCRDATLYVDSLSAASSEAITPYDGEASLTDVATSRVADYDGRSFLAGANAGIVMHADMAGADTQATAYIKNSIITTSQDDVVFEDGTTAADSFDPSALISRNGIVSYLQWKDLHGACILMKSHSGKVDLDNCELNSETGVAVRTAFVYDSMASGIYPTDGTEYIGDEVDFRNMTVNGDIIHDDYMRKMDLNLENTQLNGKVVSTTCAGWNAKWATIDDPTEELKALGVDTSELTFDEDEVKASFIYNESYETIWGVRMNMDANSVWTVTGDSSLYSLTLADGAVIQAPEGQSLEIYVNVAMNGDDTFYDYTTGTKVDSLEPGKTYQGVVILVSDGDTSASGASDSSMTIGVNGQQVGTANLDPSQADGSYSIDISSLLSSFGLSLQYDEDTGDVTITDSTGILGALLNQNAK